jgi:hypothetical protein
MMIPIVISYIAVLLHERAPERGARLLGYAESRLAALDWQQTPSEARIHDRLQQPLRVKFSGEQLDALFAEGARWNEDRAVAQALDSL